MIKCKLQIFVEYSHYFTDISSIINTKHVAKLSTSAFVAQMVEHCPGLIRRVADLIPNRNSVVKGRHLGKGLSSKDVLHYFTLAISKPFYYS